jgi:hypothetical protein
MKQINPLAHASSYKVFVSAQLEAHTKRRRKSQPTLQFTHKGLESEYKTTHKRNGLNKPN